MKKGAKKEMIKIFEKHDFSVCELTQDNVECAEVETWTAGGVNMAHFLNPFSIKSFEEIVDGFDVDEEIDIHRQSGQYKAAFRISDSIKDFEEYLSTLKNLLSDLKEIEECGEHKGVKL